MQHGLHDAALNTHLKSTMPNNDNFEVGRQGTAQLQTRCDVVYSQVQGIRAAQQHHQPYAESNCHSETAPRTMVHAATPHHGELQAPPNSHDCRRKPFVITIIMKTRGKARTTHVAWSGLIQHTCLAPPCTGKKSDEKTEATTLHARHAYGQLASLHHVSIQESPLHQTIAV